MLWKAKYILLIVLLTFSVNTAFSQTESEEVLKAKIEERSTQIKTLEEEILKYNLEVINAGTQAKTLVNTIKTLDLTKKKISTDINLTQSKISKTELTIEQLENEIEKTVNHIETNKKAIISALKSRQELESIGMFQILLSKGNIGEIWKDLDNLGQIQETVRGKTTELGVLKVEMEKKQETFQGQKKSLVNLKQDLNGKKQAVESTVKEKATVLAITKNKEQAFKELVKTKEEQKEQFEQELFEYESQLNILIDKGSYPKAKFGILSWPLDNIFVTQRFGKTVGAEKLYTSGSHNGIDMRASVGSKVKNVLDGTVVGTGNTDVYRGCYSFGKWVMVRHKNGLSTIFAHLSAISTSVNQELNTGDLIGYSGNTGYSTGPHLHISVYATQGVRIEQYVNSRGCKQATMPLADVKAYLDPMAYFPRI